MSDNNDTKIKEILKRSFSYPSQNDENIQEKIYTKKEFNNYRISQKPEIKNYAELKQYRDGICNRSSFALLEHQNMLSNFINPNTPYSGVLIYHGLGTGKCLTKDTLVYVNGNIMPIEKIWNNYVTETYLDKNNMSGYWSKPSSIIRTTSFDESNNPIPTSVEWLYRQYVREFVKEITLENGMIINITQEHSLLTKNGWTTNIKYGDEIFVPSTSFNFKNGTNISPEVITLIAYIISKSSFINNSVIKIPTLESTFFELILKSVQSQFSVNDKIIPEQHEEFVSYNIPIMINNLKNNNLLDNEITHIPDVIMNSSLDNIKLFLRIYLNNIHDKRDGYMFIVPEKIIAHQLIQLLRLFNFECVVHKFYECHVNSYLVAIPDKFVELFELEFGLTYTNQNIKYVSSHNNYFKVVNINFKYYNDFVYDLNIKKYHNFVADGILCHNTCVAVAIAERFKEQVAKYGTKIHILVPGPILKENWREQIVSCSGNTYIKQPDKNQFISKNERALLKKEAIGNAMQYYRLLSYRGFYKKVLGAKITETIKKEGKKTYKKTDTGEFVRDVSFDRIFNLNNSLLIVDEAHNLTGNEYGDAVNYIIHNSTNLKVVLLTATPMKNLADDIVPLINILRPENDKIDRDLIFSSEKNHDMQFKDGGLEYLRTMVRGYVSHLRGGDPLVFAKRVDHGIIPKSLLFTKIIPCKMSDFQQKIYDDTIKNLEDALDRKTEAVANFAFPCLSDDSSEIISTFGKVGLSKLKNQLKINKHLLNEKLAKHFHIEPKDKETRDLIGMTHDGKLYGELLSLDNLKNFSIKFYEALTNINKLVWGEKGAHTAFIYSNLVKVGIDLFKQVLLQNGYVEYSNNIQINSNTKCYFCGIPKSQHHEKLTKTIDNKEEVIPKHTFMPATFMSVTGKSSEELQELLPEESKHAIDDIFNNINNLDGKYIKFILGSKVINEGISMKNVKEVHVLDVYYNFGRVDQVVGRAIRWCSHNAIMSENTPYPEVDVYKYAIVSEENPTSEELLYQKAEQKHLLIKKVERILKEEAFDCALNRSGNIFDTDIKQYKDCGTKDNPCPAVCDYEKCDYKCSNKNLNDKFFDEKTNSYKNVARKDLDLSTFSKNLARDEINLAKQKIKELFTLKYVYTLDSIINHVKMLYPENKRDTFEPFYVYMALDEFIPITENDFNNFNDPLTDKYNRQGYLIYLNNFYIFQPFELDETVPMYYRMTYDRNMVEHVSLYDYMKNLGIIAKMYTEEISDKKMTTFGYNFDSVMEYYSARKEFDIIGIIDKEPNRKRIKTFEELEDVFKIKEKTTFKSSKKRGIGIKTLTGTVCMNSQTSEYLEKLMKKLDLEIGKTYTRVSMCDKIKDKLLFMEKYSSDKKGNKMTYVIIPFDHPTYPFPYNLEDRVKYISDRLSTEIKMNLHIEVSELSENKLPYYKLIIKHNDELNKHVDFLKSMHAEKSGNNWIIVVK